MAGSITFGTGTASGIDWSAVADAIIKAKSRPITNLQNQVSIWNGAKKAFSALGSALDNFETKLRALRADGAVGAKKTTLGSLPAGATTPFSASAGTDALTGSYAIEVHDLAKAHRVRSAGVADAYSPIVADGTISIQAEGEEAITIDVSAANGNNSLTAIATAINSADKGVQASVIRDGSNSILVVKSAQTGTDHELVISDATNLGLDDAQNVLQAAQNAWITVDGIDIRAQSNTIDDAIAGVSLKLTAETTGAVALDVADDLEGTKKALQEFVDAYNAVDKVFQEEMGSKNALAGSSVASSSVFRGVRDRLQALVTSRMQGIPDGNVRSLAELGVEIADASGTLKFNATKFDAIVDAGRFDEVRAVLQSSGSTSDTLVSFVSGRTTTGAGTYDVRVTKAAEVAALGGSTALAGGLATNENLTITLGTASRSVALAAGDDLTTVLGKINAALDQAGIAATAVNDGGRVRLASDEYGSAQVLKVVSDVADAGDGRSTGFGTTEQTDAGVDVAGTIGGVLAVGLGRDLKAAEESPAAGLIVRIYATDAAIAAKAGNFGTVGYSKGAADLFLEQIDAVTDPFDGTIKSAQDGYDKSIKSAQEKITRLQDMLAEKRDQLLRQFSAAEQAVAQLNAMMAQMSAQTR